MTLSGREERRQAKQRLLDFANHVTELQHKFGDIDINEEDANFDPEDTIAMFGYEKFRKQYPRRPKSDKAKQKSLTAQEKFVREMNSKANDKERTQKRKKAFKEKVLDMYLNETPIERESYRGAPQRRDY